MTDVPASPEVRPYPAPPRHAFVDAYGDPSLATEKAGVTGSFIVVAVLVDGNRTEALRREFNALRARHVGGGELKSKNVGDDARRGRILEDLATLDFRFVALVVDKSRVHKDGGLIFKSPFLKFIHRSLFERLYRAHPSLVLTVDNHGRPAFMDEFMAYVRREVQADLFEKPGFRFEDSKAEPFLQLADFIAGSLARAYDVKKASPHAQRFLGLMRTHALSVITWPPRPRPAPEARPGDAAHDHQVRSFCVERAANFLAEHHDSCDPNRAAQVALLEHLLFHFDWVSDAEWVPTAALQDSIKERLGQGLQEQQLRANVVGPLRDAEVIIASSRLGYKIPASVKDLHSFVERTDTTVYPMLQRLERARRNVSLLTGGALDILQDGRYAYLRAALEPETPAPPQEGAPGPTGRPKR